MSNKAKLSLREENIVDCLLESSGDIPIMKLYNMLYGHDDADERKAQMYVGAVVSRINLKLVGYRIVPGETKRTYVIKKIDAAVS